MKQARVETFKDWVQQLKTNPKEAISKTKSMYERREDEECSDVFIRKLAGGPSEGATWPVYNALGAVYPDLSRDLKDQALGQVLSIFDEINYGYVNGALGVGHTTGIREPLLLADIGIVRQIYWPGLDEGKNVIAKFIGFKELKEGIMRNDGMFKKDKVLSDFVVGYSLLRSDFCKHGDEYAAEAEPSFFERTLKGIIALRFGHPDADVEKGMNRLYELLPESVHDRLDSLRRESDWADYQRFR